MAYSTYRRLYFRNPVGTARASVLVVGALALAGWVGSLFENEPVPFPLPTYSNGAPAVCVDKLNEPLSSLHIVEVNNICSGLTGDAYYLGDIARADDPKFREGREACEYVAFTYHDLYDCMRAKRWPDINHWTPKHHQ